MARHREVKLIIDNHPKQFDRLKEAEKEVGRTFFPPDYIPDHARRGKNFATIEDVELYFKRKNATPDLFEEETPSCMSMYGLCE